RGADQLHHARCARDIAPATKRDCFPEPGLTKFVWTRPSLCFVFEASKLTTGRSDSTSHLRWRQSVAPGVSPGIESHNFQPAREEGDRISRRPPPSNLFARVLLRLPLIQQGAVKDFQLLLSRPQPPQPQEVILERLVAFARSFAIFLLRRQWYYSP